MISTVQLSFNILPDQGDIVTQFNVKNFGAKGDAWYDTSIAAIRGTDDTAAIQDCYNAAAAYLNSGHNPGIVYFPPSTGYYWVQDLHIPSVSSTGWLESWFDNGMYVNTIYPGSNNKFVGRGAYSAGLTGSFVSDSFAEWQQPKGATGPVVNIQGLDQVVFKGISFATQTSSHPAVKIEAGPQGQGAVFITFDGCVMGSPGETQRNPSFVANGAFGLRIRNCSMGNLYLAMGQVKILHTYLHSVYYQNPGSPSSGNVSIDDVLSEALTNENFLTIDTSGGPATDFTLRQVMMADTVGTSYMVKHINDASQSFFPVKPYPANWVANVKFDMCPEGNIGSGYIDPSSAPDLLSVICEGWSCQSILNNPSVLYDAMMYSPKDGLKVYGSGYLKSPFSVIQGTT